MAHVALYRKYRSQSFMELMGQESVTRTLQNALRSGKFAHAYLFFGARGCGKTSTARLLARALNCVAQDSPTPEPCGQCRLCLAIRDGTCLDVMEMDAASETGIDDVREKVIENVQYAPAEARYKVYIIDEVHDLSAKAFDALLKTLEEPPPYVVFVLATTELHKVPITIRSRCQQHQFKRGTLQDLAAAVERVLRAEGYTAEPEAILSIARSAEGSWRDALSLLEQVLAYSEGHVTAETAHRAIGTVGAATLARVTETLARDEWGATLDLAADLLDSGIDVRQLLVALTGHLRDLMLAATGATQAAMQELGPDRLALLRPQAGLFAPPTLLEMMSEVAKAEREIRFTNQHGWLLERTLLRLLPGSQSSAAISTTPSRVPMAAQPIATRPAPSREEVSPLAATPTVIPKPPLLNAAPESRFVAPMEDEEADETLMATPAAPPAPQKPANGHAPAAADSVPLPSAAETQENRAAPSKIEHRPSPVESTSNDRFAPEVTLEVIQRAWPRIFKMFEKVSPGGAVSLKKADIVALDGKTIVLQFKEAFARDRIQNKGRDLIEKAINKGLNTEGYKIRCFLEGQGESLKGTAGDLASAPARAIQTTGEVAAPPAPDMSALLDTPPTPTANTRIADFDLPPSSPSTASLATAHKGNGVSGDPTPGSGQTPSASATPQPAPLAAAPPSSGLLAETLDIFGGQVIKSEPLK